MSLCDRGTAEQEVPVWGGKVLGTELGIGSCWEWVGKADGGGFDAKELISSLGSP